MKILGIETSCDETAAAVVVNGEVCSSIVLSQSIHSLHGGIVPELASREHVKAVSPVVRAALNESHVSIHQIDAIAVTNRPGLAGALLVGANFARGLSIRKAIPVIAVDHIHAHALSASIEHPIQYPYCSLVVSGGHTTIFLVQSAEKITELGSTKDDAAGEAFDKVAAMLGLGYPGGPAIQEYAVTGNASRFQFPRALMRPTTDVNFSFSGLKTAVRRAIAQIPTEQFNNCIPDLCAAVQAAICDVLVEKLFRVATHYGVSSVCVAGGVAANTQLRRNMAERFESSGIRVYIPSIKFCIDNAAMIANVARLQLNEQVVRTGIDFVVSSVPTRAPRFS